MNEMDRLLCECLKEHDSFRHTSPVQPPGKANIFVSGLERRIEGG